MGSGRDLSDCFTCIKYLLFGFNFLFWLIGVGLVGFGIWMLLGDQFEKILQEENLGAYVKYFGWAVIGVGAVILMVGFFGCCGGIRESQCLLVSFFICLFFLFAALCGGGIYVIIENEAFFTDLNQFLATGVRDIRESKETPAAAFTAAVQTTFECCATDLTTTVALDNPQCVWMAAASGGNIIETVENAVNRVTGPNCKDTLQSLVSEYSVVLGGVFIGVGAVMLLGMIFAMLLCCAIRDVE